MLMYTAELRLPTTLSATERRARVDEVLSTLGLEACANTVIGGPLQRGISGGQLKRTNIGLALITKPSVIFLDEPTSGLDSHMANEVAVSLAALAADGRTVVCTIHSPTSYAFSKFDDLIMLKQGRVAYHGPCDSVAGYLQKTCGVSPPQGIFYSLPEWLVSVTSEATGDSPPVDWVALFEKSTLRKDADALRDAAALGEASGVALAKEAKMPGSMHQLGTLLRYRMTVAFAMACAPREHPCGPAYMAFPCAEQRRVQGHVMHIPAHACSACYPVGRNADTCPLCCHTSPAPCPLDGVGTHPSLCGYRPTTSRVNSLDRASAIRLSLAS